MASKSVTRRELLERWRSIEEEDDDDSNSTHPIKRRRFRQLKEQWFSDAFNFLIYMPKESHIWCGYWDLMGPLLETFYNYPKDERNDSPLKLLWTRISQEMRTCAQCVHQHHQSQEMYETEYEHGSIGALLDVLRTLDEEQITQHLKDINVRIAQGMYDPEKDYGEVVSVMFEVLMFPILFDDQSLASEFQVFIEAIDNSHDLTLNGHQQYPGVYALLFLKSRRARSIGFRLAAHMGKLRGPADLDPLQHFLKKCICFLETEGQTAIAETSRPRMQLDRLTVWIGMKALLSFMEPLAFEEGILDRYPIFLSIVLNHISDDSPEFSHAVNCLRLMFEKLGCKLWLRATLSPSVMRNTLVGQCFHTRNEKTHKEIFDLFQPFLQSLEPLQDGEHEKQRRHFLYFLLHQVTVSSNFSMLMRKKSCQVALLIVLRGYRMNPPCPPFECAHMWGPSLVSSLKDSSLHCSLRQPAFDLVQTIIVSDASALTSIVLKGRLHPSNELSGPNDLVEAYDDEEDCLFGLHFKEMDSTCWNEFIQQNKIASVVHGGWMCVPMLWFDVLVEIDPLVLPMSFSKAVFWALSRFSMVEPESRTEMTLSVRTWLTTCASEISYLFGWKVPSGSDDGGDGSESKNSIRVSTMCLPLVRTLKRLAAHYTIRMEHSELRKKWIWEPMMSESLILLLLDPDDNPRQVGRHILEQVSDTRGLTSGLQFLCSNPASLSAIFLGLQHAMKMIQLDSILMNFQTLHHFFFILCKLLREGNSSTQPIPQNLSDVSDGSKFSSQGGFLRQPIFDSSPIKVDEHSSVVSSTLWDKFSSFLAEIAWPSIQKCLAEGKAFIDNKLSQMTCIRLLEVMPVVFKRLRRNVGMMVESADNMKWLHDLMDWGKSSLAVVVRYWKETLITLLGLIKASCKSKSASAIEDIESLISCENVPMDEVTKQVARLSVSLMDESSTMKKTDTRSKLLSAGDLWCDKTNAVNESKNFFADEANVHNLDKPLVNLEICDVIELSDDEKQPDIAGKDDVQSHINSSMLSDTSYDFGAAEQGVQKMDSSMNIPDTCYEVSPPDCTDNVSQKIELDAEQGQKVPFHVSSKLLTSGRKEIDSKGNLNDSDMLQNECSQKTKSDKAVNLKGLDSFASQGHPHIKASSDRSRATKSVDLKIPKPCDPILEEVVRDTVDDTWDFSFFKPQKCQQALVTRASTSGPKRQVIQLNLPVENRSGSLRLNGGLKRFKPPRLDDWYRSILQLDFFLTVGLASGSDTDNQNAREFKEVPVCFKSPDEYIEIFRPLVLEEFKAQLQGSFQEMASTEEMLYGSLSVLSVERIDDFHVVRFVHDEDESTKFRSFLENDLILLTRQPLRSSSHDVHVIGKVDRCEKDNKRKSNTIAIRLYLQGCSRLNRARKLLNERSKWFVSRLMSITPQLREFQALSSIREIPLLPIILNPVNHHCHRYETGKENIAKLSPSLQQVLRSSYNESQLNAISVAIGPFDSNKNFEFTLIQGPPGTGKTRTIVAIVSGLLASSQTKDNGKFLNNNMSFSNASNNKRRISQSAAVARAWQDAALARQLNEDVGKSQKSMGSCTRGRILICAQSNAAVDELVSRLSSEGLYGSNGVMCNPYLVRVGNSKTVHSNSLPFFIDTLVENRLAAEEKTNINYKKIDKDGDLLATLRSNLEKIVDHIRYYEAKRANLQEGNMESRNLLKGDGVKRNAPEDLKELSDAELGAKLRTLYEKKKAIYADLAAVQAREKKASDESRALRHKIRKAILKEAEIVVTTLSGCGGDLYGVCSETSSSHKFCSSSENVLFDAVVIDEAAQALEPATLIPLQLLKSKRTRCIMVGDPKQLPATVLSNVASKYLFQCSMFERLERAGHPVVMLNQQYRMHPEICHFPSSHFYDGKLLNGDQMSDKSAPFHKIRGLGPYVFFDIMDGQELHGKNSAAVSLYNECEAEAAVEVLRFFKKRRPSDFIGRRIGIITPYRCQLSLLRSRFSSAFGSSFTADVEFNTVDGFQGREVDILVLSTVRAAGLSSEASKNSNLGFVADVRRMNVALTRARLSLWILGNARTLKTNRSWAALVKDAKERDLIISIKRPYSSIFRSVSENQPSSTNVVNHSSQSEHAGRVEAVSDDVDQQMKIMKHSSERKRKHRGYGEQNTTKKGHLQHTLSASDAATDNKNPAREESNFPVKEDSSCKNYMGRRPPVKERPVNKDKSWQERISHKKIAIEKGDVGKEKNLRTVTRNPEKVRGESHNNFKSLTDERFSEPVKDEKRQRRTQILTQSSEESLKDNNKGVHDATSNPVEVPKDSIMKRKQQRHAVDALLSSALISSKKAESSKKPVAVKRTFPTASMSDHPNRPPKHKKG